MRSVLLWCALAAGLLFLSTEAGVVRVGAGCVPNFAGGPYRCDGVLCGSVELVVPTALPQRLCYWLDFAFFVGVPVLLLLTLPLAPRHGYGGVFRPRYRDPRAGRPAVGARPALVRRLLVARYGFNQRRLGAGLPRRRGFYRQFR